VYIVGGAPADMPGVLQVGGNVTNDIECAIAATDVVGARHTVRLQASGSATGIVKSAQVVAGNEGAVFIRRMDHQLAHSELEAGAEP